MLVNCSPDIAEQVESYPPLQPRQKRGTPIDAMLFTDANIDHLGGLAVVRQTGTHHFHLHSSNIVRSIAAAQPAFAPFTTPPHTWVGLADRDVLDWNGLEIRVLDVPGTTPGYDGRRTVNGAVVAYEVREETKSVLFAPVFSAMNRQLEDAISRSQVAFLDGSFFTDDELVRDRLSDKTARHLGHLPVSGAGGTLERLHDLRPRRIIFTHLNNSNPMLDPDSAAASAISAAGAEIAFDGMELAL